jgi:hypothetical protein
MVLTFEFADLRIRSEDLANTATIKLKIIIINLFILFLSGGGTALRFPLAPGFRRVATAIRRHTPSSKGARLMRSS